MDIYRIVPGGSPRGSGILERTQFFARVARQRLETFYPDSTSRPDHLVHVSCTGYISPSAAQSLVNTRGWSGKTAVTHAYHMGCYASIPAVRIAAGHLALSRKPTERVDIVHTELCSLHLDSQEHSPEQAVVQSLFGDGHVRYSLTPSDGPRPHKGFELFGIHEYIVPGTESSMSWQTADWGMKMTLSRDVPRLVGGSIEGFIRDLLEPSGLSLEEAADAAVFAVHPGGPKIIDFVQDKLKLQDAQVRQSRDVLRKYGNMSSATLPHVWKEILEDESVPAGKPIISLAFGPGLTVFGLLMRKV
jgi:predicted naringenin-chalcone synthase